MKSHSATCTHYLEKFKTEGIPLGLEGIRPEPFQSLVFAAAYVAAAIEVWGDNESIFQRRCRHEVTHDGHPSRYDRRHHPHLLF